MSNPDKSPAQGKSLLRMRHGPTDDKSALAKRLLDPAYIRSVLQKQPQKNAFNLKLQRALKVQQPKKPLVPRPQLHPRHPVPAARKGEASDVLDALMGIPAIKQGINTVQNKAAGKLKRDWKHLQNSGKAALITHTVLIAGGSLAGALASNSGRTELYNLLKDREIPMPVPGVPGLQIQLKTGKEHKAMLMFDIAEFLRSD